MRYSSIFTFSDRNYAAAYTFFFISFMLQFLCTNNFQGFFFLINDSLLSCYFVVCIIYFSFFYNVILILHSLKFPMI